MSRGVPVSRDSVKSASPVSEGVGTVLATDRLPEVYGRFLDAKRITVQPSGFAVSSINPKLFDFQRDIVKWGLRKGKCCFFEDCGLGKTAQELEWSAHVVEQTGKPVINFAPLAVSHQTKGEGDKFGIPVTIAREQAEITQGVNIANYEMLEHFDPREFSGVVIDESSILKGDGPLRKAITDFAYHIPYRLAATATPAPNDYMELGNHLEFLGIMSKSEMLATFFVHDGGDTSKWRLKGHAESAFWRFIAQSCVMVRKPSDLGYSDKGFDLPELEYHQHTVAAKWSADYLFPVEAQTLQDRQAARRDSIQDRAKLAAELVNKSEDQWLLWTNLNAEGEALACLIPDCIRVTGSDTDRHKEQAPLAFVAGKIRVLESKPKILGWGMNFQNCQHAAAVGLSDSWEALYQITRRIWRFGQTQKCHMHIITGELEGAVVRNIERKEKQAAAMGEAMLGHMREINTAEIHGTVRETENYIPRKAMQKPGWLCA